MHIPFALFADAANISQEGKLNILGVFDAVHVGSFPSVHPRAHLVLRFKGGQEDAGRHVVGFRWTNPRGTEIWSSSGELDLAAGGNAEHEMDLPMIAVVDLPFDVPGRYTMHVDLDGTAMATLSLQASPPVTSFRPTSGLLA